MRWSEEERRSQYAEVFLMEEDIENSEAPAVTEEPNLQLLELELWFLVVGCE